MKLTQQHQYERAAWCRLLDYLQEENIHYKNRIADILRNDIGSSLIETLELFLNKFVQEDSIISLLRHDIAELNKKIPAKESGDEQKENLDKIILTQDKLRKEVETIEQQFNKLKFTFNKYLSGHPNTSQETSI